ncbi:MAG: hypothetical protein VR72_01180 [Clostridiaceae bacterium BRH_c20a]|nr:MAG: hypothetical protein VR72_01180 [Clostridiaceae bacterium BRH_c20a]
MELNALLACDFEDAQKELIELGYNINDIKYLNNPPGAIKIVRIREGFPKNVELVVTYHNNMLGLSNRIRLPLL